MVISTNYMLLIRIDFFRVLLNQTLQFIPVYPRIIGCIELLPFMAFTEMLCQWASLLLAGCPVYIHEGDKARE